MILTIADEVLLALDKAIERAPGLEGWAPSIDVANELGRRNPTQNDLCSIGQTLAWLRKWGLVDNNASTNSPRLWTITSAGDDKLYDLQAIAA